MQAVDLDLDLGAIATTACDEWREFRTRIARSKAVARFSCFARQVRVSLFTRLTPELSRAAKRRRLGRIVRRDVKAEADLLQAGATTVMRGSLAASREHHRGQ